MKKIEELRTIEVRQDDETWVKLQSIGQLEPGDVFRMFEPTGDSVADKEGNTVFVCRENAQVLVDSATILDIV